MLGKRDSQWAPNLASVVTAAVERKENQLHHVPLRNFEQDSEDTKIASPFIIV